MPKSRIFIRKLRKCFPRAWQHFWPESRVRPILLLERCSTQPIQEPESRPHQSKLSSAQMSLPLVVLAAFIWDNIPVLPIQMTIKIRMEYVYGSVYWANFRILYDSPRYTCLRISLIGAILYSAAHTSTLAPSSVPIVSAPLSTNCCRYPVLHTSTLAPSSVPTVSAPLSMNFMLPVPLASVPAVLI